MKKKRLNSRVKKELKEMVSVIWGYGSTVITVMGFIVTFFTYMPSSSPNDIENQEFLQNSLFVIPFIQFSWLVAAINLVVLPIINFYKYIQNNLEEYEVPDKKGTNDEGI